MSDISDEFETSSDEPNDPIHDSLFSETSMKDADSAASILNIHPDVAFLCLQLCRFDLQRLLADFVLDKSTFLDRLNISENRLSEPQRLEKEGEDDGKSEMCEICYCECEKSQMLGLPCGHFFCTECWKCHLQNGVDSCSSQILCMHEGCNSHVLASDVELLCGKPAFEKYMNNCNQKFITVAVNVRRCSDKNCNLLLSCENIGHCWVSSCKCGRRTCWKCGEHCHAPLNCENTRIWKNKYKGISNDIWTTTNTKPCVMCKALIEKNGGCNHMTCQNCGYEFCWLCGHEWHTHEGDPYQCSKNIYINKPQYEENGITIHQLNFQLQKNNARLERFSTQATISCFLKENTKKTEEDIKKLLVIRNYGRRIIKWSNAYLSFMDPNCSSLKLFNFTFNNLQLHFERLCYYIEHPNKNKYSYLESESKQVLLLIDSLLKHVEEDQGK